MSHGGRMPTSSSQGMSDQFSNSSEKESSFSPVFQPESEDCLFPLDMGHMTIPEPITEVWGMEYADWSNPEQEVGPFPLNIKDRKSGEGWPPKGKLGCYYQGGYWVCINPRCHSKTTHP